MFDSKKVKLDFPIFNKKFDFGNLTYLDSAATSQKPKQVIDGTMFFYENYNANVYRSIYELGETATSLFDSARDKVAKFINAFPEEIVFTSGTTEGINFVADAWAKKNISSGDQIVITNAEHHANLLPWQRVAHENKAELKFLKLNFKNFLIDLSDLEKIINEKTKLVAITHSSNMIGDVWGGQLEKVIKRARQVGAKILIDAAQTAPRQKIDVKKLDADFLVFSGHKMLGPTGVGVLFIKKEMHDSVEPYQVGGSMVYSVSLENATWKQAPYKFEAGTPPIAQVIGLGYAIDYLNSNIDFDALQEHEALLCTKLIQELEKIEGVRILGNKEDLKKIGHLVSFAVNNIHAHDLGAFLGQKGVSVRSGNHCAQPLAILLGAESSLRVSFYIYNTLQDVEIFVDELKKAIKFFRA
jgi:cysteine desulfurase / selenocysteine lyase